MQLGEFASYFCELGDQDGDTNRRCIFHSLCGLEINPSNFYRISECQDVTLQVLTRVIFDCGTC